MKLDLDRVLELTRNGQWAVEELPWAASRPEIAAMSPKIRREAGQVLLLLAGLERQAANAFESCRRHVEDPVAREIYRLFRDDEHRHALAEERLAAEYGVGPKDLPRSAKFMLWYLDSTHRYHERRDPAGFFDRGSSYLVLFELGFDTLFIPALNRLAENSLQNDIFRRIERDETRHLAMDYWLLERRGRAQESIARKFATALRWVGVFFVLMIGFGLFLTFHSRMRRHLVSRDLIQRFRGRIAGVDEKAPHAQQIASYRGGLRSERLLLGGVEVLGKTVPALVPLTDPPPAPPDETSSG
jgi:hypothetical protein